MVRLGRLYLVSSHDRQSLKWTGTHSLRSLEDWPALRLHHNLMLPDLFITGLLPIISEGTTAVETGPLNTGKIVRRLASPDPRKIAGLGVMQTGDQRQDSETDNASTSSQNEASIGGHLFAQYNVLAHTGECGSTFLSPLPPLLTAIVLYPPYLLSIHPCSKRLNPVANPYLLRRQSTPCQSLGRTLDKHPFLVD